LIPARFTSDPSNLMPTTVGPAEVKSRIHAAPVDSLDRVLRFALFAIVFLVTAARAPAELYQTIKVNVMSAEKFRMGRVVYSLEEMTTVVASEVRGSDRVRVLLYIPLGMKKALIEEIKDRCRKAGTTSFHIQYKA
jgi:hypothetical protein